MSNLSNTMRDRFDTAVDVISLFLNNGISAHEVPLEAISELKGMFNQSLRRDQWTWFTVYDRLGYPSRNQINYIVSKLVKLRTSLKERDFKQALSICSELAKSTLPTHLSQWKNYTDVPSTRDETGWLYILSRKDEPDILKIGMTTHSVTERVKKLNSATGVLIPYSARAVYKVEHPREAERLVFKLLLDYRIRVDREFFRLPFGKAVKVIEAAIFPFLIRTQGEVKWFDDSKGYGFITSRDYGHQSIIVHKSQIRAQEIHTLRKGQKVKFDTHSTQKGLSAVNVVITTE